MELTERATNLDEVTELPNSISGTPDQETKKVHEQSTTDSSKKGEQKKDQADEVHMNSVFCKYILFKSYFEKLFKRNLVLKYKLIIIVRRVQIMKFHSMIQLLIKLV